MNYPEQINEHLLPVWQDTTLVTPAYVFDEVIIDEKLRSLNEIKESSNCNILYSIKALSFTGVLEFISQQVDGFSTSSVFESKLAREISGDQGIVSMTSPGFRAADMSEINMHCDYISFNSISQLQQFKDQMKNISVGLRVNPGLSFVKDVRYDPCRKYSKLGVSLNNLSQMMKQSDLVNSIDGILIHNNCESNNYDELVKSINNVRNNIESLFEKISWINLGGGYLVNEKKQLEPLCKIINELAQDYALNIFIEPGKAIVGEAGYLVTTVIDMYESDGKNIAVLDTSINHLPEVFEYQYSPQLLQHESSGKYEYRLAGSSCLSGDLFGDYFFNDELSIGSRIIFSNVGAYMSVKANMFNGINLPTIYSLTLDGNLKLQRKYEYSDYRNRL